MRGQVRIPEVSRGLLDRGAIGVDRPRAVDDLEIAGRSDLVEPMAAAAGDQLCWDGRLPI